MKNSGGQFDVDSAILAALEGMQVDLAVDSSVSLDDCELNTILLMSC
jgi:hypothetical protein